VTSPPRITFAAVALLVASCGSSSADEGEPGPVRVTCTAARMTPVRDVRSMRGTVVAAPGHDAILSPQVVGRVESIAVREGDAVHVGDVVARIERQPLADALVQSQSTLHQAETAAHFADVRLTRVTDLASRGINSQRDIDDATQARDDALAQLASARAEVSVSRRNVGRAELRSPIDGVVIRVMRRAGELVDGTPATPVLEIADPEALELVASAAPEDLVVLHSGAPAHVHFEALPGRDFTGHIVAVTPAVDPATGVGSVRLVLDEAGTDPPFGLFGQVEVEVAAHSALVVPETAVRGGGGTRLEVVVCNGATATVHEVELGISDPRPRRDHARPPRRRPASSATTPSASRTAPRSSHTDEPATAARRARASAG